ncbi:flagellar basal body-associated FliL family protein [Sulfitobacter guttiformis]|uniref:Flagellar protein FliL n=1 Tax=Sulfitobacter guttiformis TaxID=74349 RepID=A0A420DSF2_9RHOB|nr:flagellar basal body-associated FliL family protein [Sulfitobacter guttiformis]KIN74582.1 Flagellar basal body-associated protein FliL [Sulfitobacter guttiformis KCTC 32187]RKE97162.1 flagellar FliL protein [Sulfitobacter guttiformis]
MADEQAQQPEDAPKKSKMPLILGLVLALAGGGGGFFAVQSGMILGGSKKADHAEGKADALKDPYADIVFVAIDPLTIPVKAQGGQRLLRFRAQLEVPKSHQEDVTKVLPRVVDVLNSYLRALEVADLEDQTALTRLRAQMLRRIQVVTGQDHVNDLLIMEFILA